MPTRRSVKFDKYQRYQNVGRVFSLKQKYKCKYKYKMIVSGVLRLEDEHL